MKSLEGREERLAFPIKARKNVEIFTNELPKFAFCVEIALANGSPRLCQEDEILIDTLADLNTPKSKGKS